MKKMKTIIAVVIVLLGIAMVGGAIYIKNQVAQGKLQVSSAERQVQQGKSLFSLNPVTQEIGGQITKSADRKIDNAKGELSYYANMAQNLQVGGIILIVLGVVFYIFVARSKSKKF